MSTYTTLVFKTEAAEKRQAVRKMAADEQCRAWSMDHELLRLDLIQKAVKQKDFSKAQEYFAAGDIEKYRADLDAPQLGINAVLTE